MLLLLLLHQHVCIFALSLSALNLTRKAQRLSLNLRLLRLKSTFRVLLTVHYAPVLAAGLFAPPSHWTFFLATSESVGGQEGRFEVPLFVRQAH